jgi:hypothetical protein
VVEGRLKPRRADLAIACFLALITLIANVTHMPYVLFPELGALGWVIFSDQRHPWARSPALLVLTPFLAAVQGLWITRHLAYGPPAVLLNVGITLLLIAVLRSPIVPALSAGLLPLALGIHTWTYPFSILIGTGGLALVIALRARRVHGPHPGPEEGSEVLAPALWRLRGSVQPLPPLRDWLVPFAVFLLGGLLLVRLIGSPLVLFPPLLVIGFEMIVHRQRCPWRGRYLSVWMVANGAAVAGLALVTCLGVGPAAAFLAVLVTLVLLKLARLPFPPALGLALLPFVIPDPPLTYPLFTMAGSLWLLVVVQAASAGPGTGRGTAGGEPGPGGAAGTA